LWFFSNDVYYVKFLEIIEGYIITNWILIFGDTKSTIGCVFTLGGCAISWKCIKQNVVSRYTMEAKILVVNTIVAKTNFYYLHDLH